MNPNIGRRAGINKRQAKKKPSAVRQFVEINTHSNITMKREYMYVEDVKEAVNINTLETRIKFTKWLKSQLKHHSKEKIIEALNKMEDKDRHRLQKEFQFTIR